MPIFTKELNINKGPLTAKELRAVIKSIQNGKACELDDIQDEAWKLEKFHLLLLHCCNCLYNQDLIDRWIEGCLLPFPQKGDLSVTVNYRGITLTAIAAKMYNLML